MNFEDAWNLLNTIESKRLKTKTGKDFDFKVGNNSISYYPRGGVGNVKTQSKERFEHFFGIYFSEKRRTRNDYRNRDGTGSHGGGYSYFMSIFRLLETHEGAITPPQVATDLASQPPRNKMNFDDLYRAVDAFLTEDWTTGKTSNRSTFKLKHLTISEKIQKATGTDIEAQFWMAKDKNNLNFEFASDHSYKTQREDMASSFRDFIFSNEHPKWLKPSTGSTVSHAMLLDKNDTDAKEEVIQFFKLVDSRLADWSSESLPFLLQLKGDDSHDSGKNFKHKNESAKEHAVSRMAKTAVDTVNGANGQQVLRSVKNKELRFSTVQALENYITQLVNAQNGLCALTGLTLQFDDQADDQELLCSLDRIDSDGHYEVGNLQVVCRFVNRWKNDGDNVEFCRLIDLLRNSGTNVHSQPGGVTQSAR